MVTKASTYLFEATGKRLHFKHVSILIPDTWKENSLYKIPKYESYEHVRVKKLFLKYYIFCFFSTVLWIVSEFSNVNVIIYISNALKTFLNILRLMF